MQRLIFLKSSDSNPENKKLSKDALDKLEAKMIADCLKQFRDEIKSSYPFIKIVKEYKDEFKIQTVIDFPDDKYEEVYIAMQSIAIVDIIDAILPLEDQKGRTKEEKLEKKQSELDLSRFMK